MDEPADMSSQNRPAWYLLDGAFRLVIGSGNPVPADYVVVAAMKHGGRFRRGCCPFAARLRDLGRRRPGGSDPPGR
jgi:hypothetical protein